MHILYGGSVEQGNIADLDGDYPGSTRLVGGASRFDPNHSPGSCGSVSEACVSVFSSTRGNDRPC